MGLVALRGTFRKAQQAAAHQGDVFAQGVTVLLVEQNASRALSIANRGYVMESGLISMTGPGQELLNDPKVRAAYLGE
jgi:branched-chain amino acid transport system ATP-binding protein